MNEQYQLTSTTAPGRIFSSRKELADHYKSDWHKYNLKRREAGLPLLLEGDFLARLEAAKAMRQEEKQEGTSHLKRGKKNKKKQRNQRNSQQGATVVSQASGYEQIKKSQEAKSEEPPSLEDEHNDDNETNQEVEENIVIDPKQCLFDRHVSATVEANVERMYRKYGFFLPDREYLFDVEGLIGYCHEKIKLGHVCLYCHKVFPTWEGCQKHMVSKQHTKLRYEQGFDLDEYTIFYDFSEADKDFLTAIGARSKQVSEDDPNDDALEVEGDNDADWEDVSDDEEAEEDDAEAAEEDDLYEGYEDQVGLLGFDITPLGELILPDGRIVGHRSLSRYYKQRLPSRKASTAVVAARHAAGDRLYQGQVFNINPDIDENAMALAKAGIKGSAASAARGGRASNGILVQKDGIFTAASIYRYRAAVKKQRRDDRKGMRLQNQTKMNINRMDKKHNRLMNGVSVAHAAR